MGFFKKGKSMKYKNKDGIELSFNGNDMQAKLVREVVEEAIKIFEGYNSFDGRSAEWALSRGILFLKENQNKKLLHLYSSFFLWEYFHYIF